MRDPYEHLPRVDWHMKAERVYKLQELHILTYVGLLQVPSHEWNGLVLHWNRKRKVLHLGHANISTQKFLMYKNFNKLVMSSLEKYGSLPECRLGHGGQLRVCGSFVRQYVVL